MKLTVNVNQRYFHNNIYAFLQIHPSTTCPHNKELNIFYIRNYIQNGMVHLRISVTGISCGGRFVFRMLSHMLQLFGLFLLFLILFLSLF